MSPAHIWRRLWRDELGQDLVEYALMAAFMALAAGVVLTPVAPALGSIFSKVQSLLLKYGGA
ncbi:MAG: Flp family type IVb pilin [Acidobacteriota bacterium]